MLILVFSKTITLFLAVILLSTIVIIPTLSFADNSVMSPRKQMASGIAAEDVVCKSGFALMKRTSGSAACIKPVSAEKLANTGFGIIIKEATITETEQKDNRPNILVVVLDDTGFADYAFTGSEISTPNLDSLRNEGKLFTNFHTNPTCSPTRSVLMTGVDNHLNGFGSMSEFLADNQIGMPGYEGYLNDNVVTVPQLLKDNGYHTYMTGKWHLAYGISDPTNDWEKWTRYDPHARGFEETFTVEIPGSHFTNLGESPDHVTIATRNGEQVEYPQQYIDDVFTDNMIQFIDKNHEDGKPMFMYLSFWNNHWPIQAPQEYIKKYEGKYDAGWDKIREQRFDKQKELGLIPQNMQLSPRNNQVPAWDSLNATQQKQEAKKMEIFAAMLDSLDGNLGRVVSHLKETGEYDNTMIVVFADNGAESSDPTKPIKHGTDPLEYQRWLETDYDNSFENWGNGNSIIGIGLGWAQVGNTPLLREKGFETEGGTRVPMLVKLPNKNQESSSNAFSRVTDVAITILDYAQVQHPGTTYNGQPIAPVDGKSLRPILEDEAQRVYGDDEAVGAELFGNSALYKGDWKALKLVSPFGDGKWKLYNLAEDVAEQNDLSEKYPERLNEMIKDYDEYAKRVGVIPPIGLEVPREADTG
jgi:arylsulfatase A-like enzyme